jgi:uncharacterized protein YkwD
MRSQARRRGPKTRSSGTTGVRAGGAAAALVLLGAAACAGPAASGAAGPVTAPAAATAPSPAVASAPAVAAPAASHAGDGIVPAGPGARQYASAAGDKDRAAVPRDPLRDAILHDARLVAHQLGVPLPEPDARLDLAMDDLARDLRGQEVPSWGTIDFLLAHYGIVEPAPQLLLARGTANADANIREQLAAQMGEVLKSIAVARVAVGVDRTGDGMRVLVALQDRNVQLVPIPRQIAPGAAALVAGKLDRRFSHPHVAVTGPDGQVRELAIPDQGAAFASEVHCDSGAGRYQVEVMGNGASGSTVLANFPLFCGVTPPGQGPRNGALGKGDLPVPDAEARMLALINRDRAAAGLPPVAGDGRLADVARAHSREMAETDFVAHNSPRTGTVLDRVQRAGIAPALIFENVGRAVSADQAESGFMSSPGHRGNILDRRATRVGIGIAIGKPVGGTTQLFVTQVFM